VCKDTGPLTKKRMETIDDDIAARAVDFIQRNEQGRQTGVCLGQLHPHASAHPHQGRRASVRRGDAEPVPRHHDRPTTKNVGQVLKVLDDLKIADNTFVMYSTDNGPHMNSWPDGAMTPFRQREEHELGRRLPGAVHGPLAGAYQAGNGLQRDRRASRLVTHLPAIAGDANVKDELLKGYKVGNVNYKGPSRRRQPRPVSDRAG